MEGTSGHRSGVGFHELAHPVASAVASFFRPLRVLRNHKEPRSDSSTREGA